MPRRVLAIITDELRDEESIEELCHDGTEQELELRLVAPAVEANPLHHTLGTSTSPSARRSDAWRPPVRPSAGPGSMRAARSAIQTRSRRPRTRC
jgi:hypothetical protein